MTTYAPITQCTGKMPYVSRAEAMTIHKRSSGRHRKDRGQGRVHAYRCSHCDNWHLGHKP